LAKLSPHTGDTVFRLEVSAADELQPVTPQYLASCSFFGLKLNLEQCVPAKELPVGFPVFWDAVIQNGTMEMIIQHIENVTDKVRYGIKALSFTQTGPSWNLRDTPPLIVKNVGLSLDVHNPITRPEIELVGYGLLTVEDISVRVTVSAQKVACEIFDLYVEARDIPVDKLVQVLTGKPPPVGKDTTFELGTGVPSEFKIVWSPDYPYVMKQIVYALPTPSSEWFIIPVDTLVLTGISSEVVCTVIDPLEAAPAEFKFTGTASITPGTQQIQFGVVVRVHSTGELYLQIPSNAGAKPEFFKEYFKDFVPKNVEGWGKVEPTSTLIDFGDDFTLKFKELNSAYYFWGIIENKKQ